MTRVKAMSADRGMMAPVTPKQQMDTPLALLRYAKAGEHIISLSGSPVIAANQLVFSVIYKFSFLLICFFL